MVCLSVPIQVAFLATESSESAMELFKQLDVLHGDSTVFSDCEALRASKFLPVVEMSYELDAVVSPANPKGFLEEALLLGR